MKIRATKQEDFGRIILQEEQAHEFKAAPQDLSHSFTMVDKDDVVGIFSLVWPWPGYAIVSAFISATAGLHMTGMVRKCKVLIENGMAETNTDRLQMTVLSGFKAGERLAEMLGFECEGVLRKYYDGKNYKLYARVR